MTYGGSRPTVAAQYGAQFLHSGVTETFSGQPAGTYQVNVYAHSSVSGGVSAAIRTFYVDRPA